jgi:2,4-dienoyl-CoA reductase-like NADH-dependent reductase (Old Yellow Enzyme family)
MYSCESDPSSPFVGALTDYHIAHLGHLALKGVGLIIIEATSVQANGRISPNDSGLWQPGADSEQFKALKRVVDFVHSQGAKIAVQLAHAGRKASTMPPWVAAEAGKRSLRADEAAGGWPHDVVGPSGGEEQIWTPGDAFWAPRELSTAEVEDVVKAFAHSAELAVKAGIDTIEIHGAHGYLLSQFLSPVTNKRTDKYGGSFENRTRLLREISAAIRAVIPEDMPLFLRISATEWLDGKFSEFWDMEESIKLAKILPDLGIDFLDVSSGGNHKDQTIEPHSNYQIDLAGQIRKEIRQAGQKTLVGAVGLITEAKAASQLVQGSDLDEARTAESMVSGSNAQADAVLLARQFLRQADWVYHAAKTLGVKITVPKQLGRAVQ